MSDRDQFDLPSTGSMWTKMFDGMTGGGLGALMKLVADPGLRDNAQKAMQAIVESHFAVQRIEASTLRQEAMLRALCQHSGVPHEFVNAVAALPDRRADGAGRPPGPARAAADDGAGGDANGADQPRHRAPQRPASLNGGD